MEKKGKRTEQGGSPFVHGKKKAETKGTTKTKGVRTTRKRALARVCREAIATANSAERMATNKTQEPTATGFEGYVADILKFLTDNPTLGTTKDIAFQFKKPDPITEAALAYLKKDGEVFITNTGFIVAKGVLVGAVETMKAVCDLKGYVEISDLRNRYGDRFSRKLMMVLLELIDESGCFYNSGNKRYVNQGDHSTPNTAHGDPA